MKAYFTFLMLAVYALSYGQSELVNVYTSQSSVHGGTPDGGIAITTRYVFVAQKAITLYQVQLNNEQLSLDKGDTLVVALNEFQPYQQEHEVVHEIDTDLVTEIEMHKAVLYKGSPVVSIAASFYLNQVLTYSYKNEYHTAKVKANIDQTNVAYAP